MREAWRAAFRSPSFYGLAVANFLPMAGVLFLGWRAEALIVFYLAECVVVYGVTVKMLAVVSQESDLPGGRYVMLSSLGLLIAGVFVILASDMKFWSINRLAPDLRPIFASREFLLGVAILAATHVYSYFRDFIGRGEHDRLQVRDIQVRCVRLFAGVLLIMFIAPTLFSAQAAVAFAVGLIAVKTLASLSAFVRERARAARSTPTSIAAKLP